MQPITNFFQSVWAEPTGRIFLVTVFAYFFSYLIYSGYIGWFTGGSGSISVSQVGFTIVDFLGLIPTVYSLLFKLAKDLAIFLARLVFAYVIAPLMVYAILFMVLDGFKITAMPYAALLYLAAPILWMIGFVGGFSSYLSKGEFSNWSVFTCFLAAILLSLTSPSAASLAHTTSPGNQSAVGQNFITEILLLFTSFIFVPILFYYLGTSLARVSITDNFLSRIQKLVLNIPYQIQGLALIEEPKKSGWSRPPKPEIFTYTPASDHPIYLVGTFSKNTAIYVSQNITGHDRGKLIILANDTIRAMEMESSKTKLRP